MIRLALVGFGKWGRNYVRAAYDSGLAEVTHIVTARSVMDSDRDAAAGRAEVHFGLSSLVDIVPLVDAVIIAADPYFSASLCEIALRLGKPIMVEKPAAMSEVQAQRIVEAEQASKTFVLVNHQHLFAQAYEDIRSMAIDRMSSMDAYWRGPGPVREYSSLWDYGPHAVSAALGIMGRPESPFVRRVGHDSRSHEFILLDRQIRARVCVSNSSPDKTANLVVRIDDVAISYDGYAPAEPPLTRSVRAFAQAVQARGTDDWRFGARWAVDVARVIEHATESSVAILDT